MSARKPAVRLTREAAQDYDDLTLYSRRTWGAAQMTAYRAAIGQALRRLRDHPQLGLARDDLFLGCRGMPVEQHIVYYHQPEPTVIVVLRILHVRQDATTKIQP